MILFFRILLIIIGFIIAVVTIVTTFGEEWFNRHVRKEIDQLNKDSGNGEMNTATQEMLEKLPPAIQRYLIYIQILNKPIPRTIQLVQEGTFKRSQEAGWIPFNATQYVTLDPPGFLWLAKMKMAPFTTLTVRDRFMNGMGSMKVKLLSVFSVVHEESSVIDQGALVRYLGEMVWFPYGFLSPYITWKSIDHHTVHATLTVGELSVTGIFHINDTGEITHFEARRMRYDKDGSSWEQYINKYSNYHMMGACRIPIDGEAGWDLSSGYFTYIQVHVKEVKEIHSDTERMRN